MMSNVENSGLISVVIPIYNSAKYIEKTLRSVFCQDYVNFEVILVDDGCTDESIEIVQELLEQYNMLQDKVRIICQTNKGLSGARNTGIKNACGDYVCFVDSDDIIERNHLSSMYRIAHDKNLDIVCCRFETTYETNREGTVSNEAIPSFLDADQYCKAFIDRTQPIFVCGLLLKKDLINKENLLFNEELRFGEDTDYMIRLLYVCKEIGFTNRATYKYLARYGSMMKTISLNLGKRYIHEIKNTYTNKIKSNIEKKNLIEMAYYREMIGFIHAFAMSSNYKEFIIIAKELKSNKMCRTLIYNGDLKIKIYTLLYRISPRLLFLFTKCIMRKIVSIL